MWRLAGGCRTIRKRFLDRVGRPTECRNQQVTDSMDKGQNPVKAFRIEVSFVESDNVGDHRAAGEDPPSETALSAAPCASHCSAFVPGSIA